MSAPQRAARCSVLGVPVDACTQAEVVATILSWTDALVSHVAVGVNANVCNLAARNPQLRQALGASDLAYADGQSIVWAAKALGTPLPQRVATTDLIYPLIEACAASGKRVFFFGAAPGVAERAAQRLRRLYPGVQIAVCDGYLDPSQTADLIGRILAHRTDVLFVGLGDPAQQYWIAEHGRQLRVPAILSCGGLFDWTSGANRRAPRWMISAGLEWLWRLLLEPRRLAKRYLLGNPAFLLRFAAQFTRARLARQ